MRACLAYLVCSTVFISACHGQLGSGVQPGSPVGNVVDVVGPDTTEQPSSVATTASVPVTVKPVVVDESSPSPATPNPVIPRITVGEEQANPGKSCNDIYQRNVLTRGKSGKYWVTSLEKNTAIEVVCNMELECDGSSGGWLEVVNFDASDTSTVCPRGWVLVNSTVVRACVGGSIGCTRTHFKTHGIQFHKVCGYVKGFQKGATDGFQPSYNNPSINAPYVDGVSITVEPPPARKHIWTYAAGLTDHGNYKFWNCPCATIPGIAPPAFVFDHYYCESGVDTSFEHSTYYTGDPLWDGQGCHHNNNCCTRPGMPWFHRSFPSPLAHDIEARICRDQEHINENIAVVEIAMYVK